MRTEPIAARIAHWLRNLWTADRPSAPDVLHEMIALAALCAALTEEAEPLAVEITRGATSLDYTKPELATALVSAAAVLRHGTDAACAQALDYLQLMDEIVPRPPVTASDVMARLAIDGMIDGECRLHPDCEQLRTGNDEVLRALLAEIETKTRFGTRRAAVSAPFPQLLEGAALNALSRYDLPLGTRALRAAAYVGRISPAGAEFVHRAQRDDGSFGDFDAALKKIEASTAPEHTHLRLQLPVAFQSLWTLAELDTAAPFRLATALFGAAVPC
jgi:hypothetical protein